MFLTPQHRGSRLPGFAVSLLVHAVVCGCLYIPRERQHDHVRRGEELFTAEQRKKIIWYDFRRFVPAVTPDSRRQRATARGMIRTREHAMVATPPRSRPGQQIVWHPAPEVKLRADLKSPNLVAVQLGAMPTAPAPPRASRVFSPPAARWSERAAPPAPEVVEPPPVEGMPTDFRMARTNVTRPNNLPKPAPRAFAAPAATTSVRLSVPSIGEVAPPVMQANDDLGQIAGSVVRGYGRRFVPPPPKAISGTGMPAPSLVGSAPGLAGGNEEGTAVSAVIGFRPTDVLHLPIPAASRETSFSRAQETGEPRAGGAGGAQVPHVSVAGERTNDASVMAEARRHANGPGARPASAGGIIRELTVPAIRVGLSAPLYPSARTLPAVIDRRFSTRTVYTVVVPIENVPGYDGDWVFWFAEREAKAGETPQVRAPVPVRKLERAAAPSAAGRVQLAALIGRDGRAAEIQVVRAATAEAGRDAASDFEQWEFRPATRNGVPIDVEVVVEIAYR